jgi:hypothetical protein
MASARVFNELACVRDNSVLTFGDSGYVLYSSQSIPGNCNCYLVVIKGDKNINEIGKRFGISGHAM